MGREQGVGAYYLFTLGSKRPSPYKVQLSVARQALEMEVDTGASLSVISEGTYKNLVPKNRAPPLEKSGIVLCTYTEQEVKPEGVCTVDVDYEGGQILSAIVSCKWRRLSSVRKELAGRNNAKLAKDYATYCK